MLFNRVVHLCNYETKKSVWSVASSVHTCLLVGQLELQGSQCSGRAIGVSGKVCFTQTPDRHGWDFLLITFKI